MSVKLNKIKTKSLNMADFYMIWRFVASSDIEVKGEFFGPVNTTEIVTFWKTYYR